MLEDKLELRDHPRSTKGTWQLTRLPEKLSPEGGNRLFVAVDGNWPGFFLDNARVSEYRFYWQCSAVVINKGDRP